MHKKSNLKYPQAILVLVCLLSFVSGCDNGPVVAPVQGIVKLDGKPLRTGTIMFYPEQGRPAVANISEDGHYELQTYQPGDGALLGSYRVTVEAFETKNAPPAPKSLEDEAAMATQTVQEPVTRSLVPEEYGDKATTPLKATVEDNNNEINFEIPAP